MGQWVHRWRAPSDRRQGSSRVIQTRFGSLSTSRPTRARPWDAYVPAQPCDAHTRRPYALQLSTVTVDSVFSKPLFSDLRRSERVRLQVFAPVPVLIARENEDRAETTGARLIVMSTCGDSTSGRLLLGSAAQRPLHHALCSVPVAGLARVNPSPSASSRNCGSDSYQPPEESMHVSTHTGKRQARLP